MKTIDAVLREQGFLETHYVKGRESIAALYQPDERCGIYVLHFIGDEYYVGQSKNVVRRYVEHRRKHSDIEKISFKRVDESVLDQQEKDITKTLEKDFTLRGAALLTVVHGKTDFDLITSPSEQDKWLDDLTYNDLTGSRPINPDLRRRYHTKYRDFLQKPYAQTVIKVLREYVQTCIPAVKRGEIDFWMCSCLPSESKYLYSRINVSWQTAFDVLINSETGKPLFRWYITKSLLEEVWQLSLPKLGREGGTLTVPFDDGIVEVDIGPCDLVKGGQDQVNLVVEGSGDAMRLIHDESLLSAVRLFNLNLMKRGPCPWGKYHCLDLADHFME